ncbi:AraC family transcriptional regulator [Paenibacillus polygoni]|uniref:AraC family transcriptional regulator n=1 Tax=Paenibacillus polygoni TaxID=3050112 RepID=A0ABY8X4K3_9BACL|nr:AraC family transcriptional regulator [Paenibacillus polygoni]WIV19968.1 AraC family transcriptional regulator [Paenibacillus polygoni]
MFQNMKDDYHEFLEIHFFNPSVYEKASAAWPIRLGANQAKPGYHIGPRVTPYYYLIMVLEGEGTFIQNGVIYPLQPGDLFCLFPQVTHEYYTSEASALHKMFFAFDGKQALSLLERTGLSPARPHRSKGVREETVHVMEEWFQSCYNEQKDYSDLERLTFLLRVFATLTVPRSVTPDVIREPSWVQKGKEYLEIHYAGGITIKSVADYVGVERTHFTKIFHKTYGISPMKYMQQLRMNEAESLLIHSSYKLGEIAQSVGYPDLFSFSKAFKNYAGISPARYRQQAEQGCVHSD